MVQENKMGTMPVNKLLISMSLPMIISMLVQAMYNVVDSVFVAQISENALTAVSLAFPLQNLMIAFAGGTAVGVNALLSRSLGEKNQEHVNHTATNSVFIFLMTALIFMIGGLTLSHLFFTVQTSNAEIVTAGTQYSMIVVGCSIGLFSQFLFERLLQATGRTIHTMITQGLGAIINIILDPIFIFVLGLGISGAAIATVISQILSASFVIFFLRCKSELKIRLLHLNEITGCVEYAKNIVSLGTAGFIMQVTNSLVSICCNNVLSVTGGDVYISVMTIVSSVRQMVETPIYAINEGSSPILSYNYGANRPGRVRKAGVVMGCLILGYTAIMWTLIIVAPHFLIQIFSSDSALIADAVPALKLYFAAFIFMDLQYIGQTFFKSLNKKKHAIFFSLLRKVVIVVPLTYIFPYLFNMGSNGVFLAEPISNVIGGSMCFITMLCTILPELKRMENK